jgi:hypothetical protein
MSDALHAINRRGKNNYYDWLSHHEVYVLQWDVRMNEIFTKMHHVITNDEYLIRYMSITCRVITSEP